GAGAQRQLGAPGGDDAGADHRRLAVAEVEKDRQIAHRRSPVFAAASAARVAPDDLRPADRKGRAMDQAAAARRFRSRALQSALARASASPTCSTAPSVRKAIASVPTTAASPYSSSI